MESTDECNFATRWRKLYTACLSRIVEDSYAILLNGCYAPFSQKKRPRMRSETRRYRGPYPLGDSEYLYVVNMIVDRIVYD